jgi:hypothetical protein
VLFDTFEKEFDLPSVLMIKLCESITRPDPYNTSTFKAWPSFLIGFYGIMVITTDVKVF